MIISIDGACKRNGKPDCLSVGAAWIQNNSGELLYKTKAEQPSTSQRGEINGLITALTYAAENPDDDDVIIITDSQYLYNTVMLEWCFKWQANSWVTATGELAKNLDLWLVVCDLITKIGKDKVVLNWTKGHLMSYTPKLVTCALTEDNNGHVLYERITTIANRPSEKSRIAQDFNRNRSDHDCIVVPEQTAVDWVVMNIMADSIASYVVNLVNSLQLQNTGV